MNPIYRRQVSLVSLDEQTVVRGQAGKRPALILSNNDFNNRSNSGLVFIVPITRAIRPFASHVPLEQPEGGLKYDSSIMCEQVKSVSTERLVKPLGTVSEVNVRRAEEIISGLLELPFWKIYSS